MLIEQGGVNFGGIPTRGAIMAYKDPFQRLQGLAESSAYIMGLVFVSVFSLHSSWSLLR